jgi:class 3 adenylate cyclase
MSPREPRISGSSARLASLLQARATPGADVRRIDGRIWDLFGEEWAVMFTDLAGFSRNVAAFGIIHFLQVIHEHHRLLLPVVADHDGILMKAVADSLLVVFRRPESAVRCAVSMQQACHRENEHRTPEEQILLCVGLGFGRLLRIGDSDVFGTEVNAASKLGEDTAQAYEILATDALVRAVGKIEGLQFFDHDAAVAGSEKNYRVKYAR